MGMKWSRRSWAALLAAAGAFPAGCVSAGAPSRGMEPVSAHYEAWVASESVDEISLIHFDGDSAYVVMRRTVGSIPVEMEAPHGVAVSPDGRYVYVTLGHGAPNGSLLKIDTRTNQLAGRTLLGLFPATVAVTPDGEYGFVSNFNLHGDHVPSSISMVHLPTMTEVARTETCTMPHGSRIAPGGSRHYSVCMMDELLVELDTATGALSRTFSLRRGQEGPVAHAHGPGDPTTDAHAETGCSPTWAEPGRDGRTLFVTCSRAAEVLEIDIGDWRVVRRFSTGATPYNLGVTPDGRLLLVSLRDRTDAALEIFDLGSGRMVGRVPTTTRLAHGIAVTEDSRYAFVTVEGIGAEPGKVDIIDLRTRRLAASVSVGQQATGVAVVPSP